LLTDSIEPILQKLHPDGQYCIGQDSGQDVGVGAGASALTGVITGDRKDTLGNAVDGAAVGGAIHLLTK
jgi:hypothetical protein